MDKSFISDLSAPFRFVTEFFTWCFTVGNRFVKLILNVITKRSKHKKLGTKERSKLRNTESIISKVIQDSNTSRKFIHSLIMT